MAHLPAGIIINCAGAGALELAGDPASARFIRGHLIHWLNKPLVKNKNDQIISYNYTPELRTYSTAGKHSDVYFYPVCGQWIFGGSRQAGTLDEEGNWQGEDYGDTVAIDGCDVPRPIIALNCDILENSFGLNPDFRPTDIRADVGYRFVREGSSAGLRIEPDDIGDKLLIHNYGHGGAGVTLSWGCALKILHIVEQNGVNISLNNRSENRAKQVPLRPHLQRIYKMFFE